MKQMQTFLSMLTLSLLWAVGSTPAHGRDELVLRVNDAIAEPGGLAAVVIRTYSSLGLSQGQACLLIYRPSGRPSGGDAAPFATLERYKVFAKAKDGKSVAEMQVVQKQQEIVLQFSSATASINRQDGPLAVLYFRMRDDLRPGQSFRLQLDPQNTAVFGRNGSLVPTELRSGLLRVRSKGAAYKAEADGDRVEPGEMAEMGVETYEPVAMASGSIGFRYDPAVTSGKPKVKMRKKYGKRRFDVDRSTPGLVLVDFRSPNNTWNKIPGEILSIKIRTRSNVSAGTRTKVSIDPSLTFFVDPDGDILRYKFESNQLEFERKDKGKDDDSDDD